MYDHWAPLMKVVHCTSRAPDIQRQLDFPTYVECLLLFPFLSFLFKLTPNTYRNILIRSLAIVF
jgi:hypothetical protein